MTISKVDLSSQTARKELPKKGVTFAYKHSNVASPQKLKSDERIQATDKRRKYMRRGSKTPSMLLFECLDWKLLSSDLSLESDDAYIPSIKSRLDLTLHALAAASDRLSRTDEKTFKTRESQTSIGLPPAPLFLPYLEQRRNNLPFTSTLPSDRRYTESAYKQPIASPSAKQENWDMTLMNFLRMKLEKTTISSASTHQLGGPSLTGNIFK